VYAPSAAEGRAWNSASSRAEEARRAARRRPFLRAIAVETGDREGRRCRWAMSRLPCARAKRLNKRSGRRMDESAESMETAVRARATARGTETLTNQCSRIPSGRHHRVSCTPGRIKRVSHHQCTSSGMHGGLFFSLDTRVSCH
jgi:hypothetical protein